MIKRTQNLNVNQFSIGTLKPVQYPVEKYVNYQEAMKPALIKLYGTSDLIEIEKIMEAERC